MTAKKQGLKADNEGDLNGQKIFPSQQPNPRPAPVAGFSFLLSYGDKMGTRKLINYKLAKIHDKGDKWFVWYQFRNPSTFKFQRFKVYEDINRITDLEEKIEYANLLKDAINIGLRTGFNPFAQKLTVAVKNWSLIQGLNYFKQHLPDRGLRPRTLQTYESVLRSFSQGMKPFLLDDIKSINKRHIALYLSKFKTGTTFNNNLTIIRAIFNYLIDAEILEINPARVKPRQETITKHRFFTEEIWEKIKTNADKELLRFILFLYHTGTRPNEARQLEHEHILKDRKLLYIPARYAKNKKDGYIPLTDHILKMSGEGKIFGRSQNYFTQKFNEVKKKLKLQKDYTLYSIKHTRAIHLAQDGASPYAIMEFFRHSSLEMTMKYLRDLGITVNREAADKVRDI